MPSRPDNGNALSVHNVKIEGNSEDPTLAKIATLCNFDLSRLDKFLQSSNESARGWSLRETNVLVSTKGAPHDGEDTVKTL